MSRNDGMGVGMSKVVQPVDISLFAGWNEPKHFSFVERTIMKMMKAPQGDFRDWAAIDAWSGKVAGQLLA